MILRNISCAPQAKARLFKEDAVPVLIDCLRHSRSDRVKEHTAATLRNMSASGTDKDRIARIVEEGALGPLIALLSFPVKRVVEQAVGTLRNLSVDANNHPAMIEDGILPPLISLLSSGNEQIIEHTIITLRNISSAPKQHRKYLSASKIGRLSLY